MPIPASQIVEVNPRVVTPGGSDLEFNALFLSESGVIPLSQFVLAFTSATDVGNYFGLDSNEYKLSATYFQGFNNSQAKPSALLFAPLLNAAQPAFVRGGALGKSALDTLNTITSGTFSITLAGRNCQLSGLNFAAATSMSAVASIIQTALQAATNANVTSATASYSTDHFVITAGANGEDATFSAASGAVAVALGLDAASATVSAGDSGTPASLTGGTTIATVASLQAITDGAMSITINGFTVELTGLDFSGISAYADAATILETAIQGAWASTAVTDATVSYSSVFDAITVTSGLAGEDESIAYPSGTVTTALLMDTAQNGAVLSAGSSQLSAQANMDACTDVTRNFVTFMSIPKLSEQEVIDYSAWAASQGVNYLHVFWDDSIGNTAASPTGTIAQALTDANAGSVCGIYGDARYAAFICSCAASIAYDKEAGTITFAFKGQSGLGANVTNGSVANTLNNIGLNFVGNYATRNDNFVFLANGEMWGDWKWIDTYLNAVWLNNALQVACMNGFANNLRVPYTEEGYTIVRSWCMDPINRALISGVIEPGVTLAEAQKAQLQREAGKDISQQLYSDGYYLKVEDPAPAVRQQRGTPDASLWYTYGGAIHKLEIASTAVV